MPISIVEVKDADGRRIGGQQQQCREGALRPDVAKAVTNVLQDTLTKGSGFHIKDDAGKTISVGAPAAAKTGTNQFNSQTWVMGYTRGLATASFFGEALGNPEDRVGRNVVVNGKFWPTIDGAYIAGPQWAYYMRNVLAHYDRGGFDPPPPNLIRAGGQSPAPSPAPSRGNR